MGQGSQANAQILPVILAGGVGARLHPISTEERPKPFIPLRDGDSLLTKTLQRVNGARFLPPLIIGRTVDRFALLNHARAAGVTPAAILLEPEPRNTAPAVALAALWARHHYDSDVCLAILAADHLISPEEAWHSTLRQAASACREGNAICLLTATPTRADTGFGYVRLGPASARHAWRKVEQFVEKPTAPEPLIAAGARWNMGQFIGTAGQFLAACEASIPATLAGTRAVLAESIVRWEFTELPPWPDTVKPASFDHAVLEKNASIGASFTGEWHDLGTLSSWEGITGLRIADYKRFPVRTDRPWGYFEHLGTRPNEVHKRLILFPNCRLSRQRHQKRAEQWRVLAGTAYIELEDTVQRLEINQAIMIPAGSWHRLANHHSDILIIEERQMGICDEADIERAEDDYGRVTVK